MPRVGADIVAHAISGASLRRLAEQEEFRSVCGFRRDLVGGDEAQPVRLHMMRIQDSTEHYHKRTWEYYYVTAGRGEIQLNGEVTPIEAGDCIAVPPGVWHTSRPADGHELHVLLIAAPVHAEGAADHSPDEYFS